MDLDYLNGLDKKKENRYQMVIISAKYARSLNRKKQQAKEDILSLETKEPINKVTDQALKDLMNDKIEFDKTNL
ncbi:MAG: DNA-directed RNA polymerase subunit omega [candidate division Zixibacteria bacterium RBG_16_40_9]|nr:MAG: DNA-directed RNA polymerase subunit omega [candidate division Zixibacteria bacterium RBG_16_40_9]